MHPDPVIECFSEDFERAFGLLESQIDMCPEHLWESKAGGYPYWQHLLHAFACMEFYALPEGSGALTLTSEPFDVVLLTAAPERAMSKDEVRALAAKVGQAARAFIARQSIDTLNAAHPLMTQRRNKPQTMQHALMALGRHALYHVGCLDTFLREHTGKGVY